MSNPILFVNTSESNVVVTGNVNVTESTTVTGDLNVTGGGELRDLPANTSDPENPVWPTPPNL